MVHRQRHTLSRSPTDIHTDWVSLTLMWWLGISVACSMTGVFPGWQRVTRLRSNITQHSALRSATHSWKDWAPYKDKWLQPRHTIINKWQHLSVLVMLKTEQSHVWPKPFHESVSIWFKKTNPEHRFIDWSMSALHVLITRCFCYISLRSYQDRSAQTSCEPIKLSCIIDDD